MTDRIHHHRLGDVVQVEVGDEIREGLIVARLEHQYRVMFAGGYALKFRPCDIKHNLTKREG